jgi:ketosteroid isomerase-like protein
MSQETVEIVRKPLRVRERASRTVDQRLFLRFPRLVDPYARLIGRLSPTSRLRQGAVWRAVRVSLEAWNRRDLDAFQLGRQPDYEYYPAHETVEAGLAEACYRGPAQYRDVLSSWFEAWGADARVEPGELIDLGDRLVLLAHVPTHGRASGVPLSQAYAWVFTLKHGQVTRQQEYFNHAEALEAVGLSE